VTGGSRSTCAGANPPETGVELQFKSSSLIINQGSIDLYALCSSSSNGGNLPVLAAPLSGTSSSFSWSAPSDIPILKIDDTGNNQARVGFHGPVLEPAGYNTINLSNASSSVAYDFGAVFQGMSLSGYLNHITNSAQAAPQYDGGRIIQLRFYNVSSQQDLGTVQIEIDDQFGQSLASNYKIISWRAAW
jgi:hypothetical protein